MLAKLVFGLGVAGLGGYIYSTVSKFDPDVVNKSPAEVVAMLNGAKTTHPGYKDEGIVEIWSIGSGEGYVDLRSLLTDGAYTSPGSDCRAKIEAIEENKTRVTADCTPPATGSAIADTTGKLKEPAFTEHIRSVMQSRPYNREWVQQQHVGVVIANMGGMQ
jgi:hypothetical protein